MTEAEWLICRAPHEMLLFLRGASDRKLRLFAVAEADRRWHLLTDDRSRSAVDVAERYADGVASRDELTHAFAQAKDAWNAIRSDDRDSRREARGRRAAQNAARLAMQAACV